MSHGQYQSGGYNKRRRGGRRYDYDDPRFSQLEERKKRMIGVKRSRDEYEKSEDKEKTVTDRLKALLVRIGERSQSSLASNLDMLSKALQVDIGLYRDYIIDTLVICVTKLSVKTSIYGTLVGLVNSSEEAFGADLVQRFRQELIEALQDNRANNDIHRVRLLVRFLSCLANANVLLGTDIIKVYKSVLKITNQNLTRFQKDHVVHAVMSALCWSGAHLCEKNPDGLTQVMTALELYMDTRGKIGTPIGYRIFKSDEGDYLNDLWEGCKKAARESWKVDSILKPHLEFSRLKKSHQHPLNWPTKPFKWTRSSLLGPVDYSIPRILDSNVVGENEVNAVERCVVTEYIYDLFLYFHADAKMCTEQLLNLTPESDIESKYLVVEAIFVHMLRLPVSIQPSIFYTRVIVELFKRQPKIWPKVIGAMINTLFHSIEKLDVECRDRIALWFGHHLANFNHQWPWNNWAFTAELKPQSAKRVFVHHVLNTSINFAYYDRVSKTVPKDMQTLMPDKHQPNYRYSNRVFVAPGTEQTGPRKIEDIAAELLRMINQRLSPDDIETLLDTHLVPTHHGAWSRLEILFLTILHAGRQSYSHVLSFITTYKNILKNMLTQRVSQVHVLKLLFEYWEKSDQHVWILTDKLQAFQMVESHAIIDFVAGPDMVDDIYKPMHAKVVLNTLHRALQTTRSVEQALAKARVDHANVGNGLNDSDDPNFNAEEREAKLHKRIRKLEQKLHKHNNHMADIFLNLLTKMVQALEKKLGDLEKPDSDLVFLAMEGRFIQLTRTYRDEIMNSKETLEEQVFIKGTTHPRILSAWEMICDFQEDDEAGSDGEISDGDEEGEMDEDDTPKEETGPEPKDEPTQGTLPATQVDAGSELSATQTFDSMDM